MFLFSKIAGTLLAPGTLFLLALCAAVVLLRTRWARAGRRLIALLAVLGLIIAVVPIGRWMIVVLENRFPAPSTLPSTVTGIVVLGGSVDQFIAAARGQIALTGSAERLVAAARLAHDYPDARLVFTGGSADPLRQDLKEASTARQVFVQLGLGDAMDAGRVLFENQSRNTHENAVRTFELVDPAPGDTWLLVSSAAHMPRAVGAFRRAGWHLASFPVDYKTTGRYELTPRFNFTGGLGALRAALHEWAGLIAYYLTDRSDALFPGPAPPT